MTIKISNLNKLYGDFKALDNISFNVEEGEIHGFLGPNGAGKSTTIRILLGFISKTSGEVSIWDKPITKHYIEHKKSIGYLPSDIAYPFNMTGNQVIDYALEVRGLKENGIKQKLAKALDIDLSKRIKDCSKGMKQKVGIIQTLVHDPKLIILDEPTTGLDPLMQSIFNELMVSERKKGKTVLMSSHILNDVEAICNKVTMIRKGIVLLTGSMDEIKNQKIKRVSVNYQGILPDLEDNKLITNIKHIDNKIKFDIKDNINDVMAILSHIDITDITIEQLSLEEIFRDYYKGGKGDGNNASNNKTTMDNKSL